MTEFDELRGGAIEWLAAAEDGGAAGRLRVAFESARQAAELAAKAILVRASIPYPPSHNVAPKLQQQGLVPEGVKAAELQRLLAEFTLGTYGFARPLHRRDVEAALRLARAMVAELGEA